MSIEKGDFIKISYTAKTEDGHVFDTTDEDVAKANKLYNEKGKYGGDVVVVGRGHVVPGLDEELIGKDVGYKGSVKLPPEKAFGIRNPELIESVPLTRFKERPAVGMQVLVDNRQGMVIRVIGRVAQVDFNKFLSGQTVIYDYEIKEKIVDREGKVQGILGMYIGKEFSINVDGETVTVEINPELSFNQRWLMYKGQITKELIDTADIKEVVYLERYNMGVLSPKTADK